MGIFEWVKRGTGAWGPFLMDLYFEHAGWINPIILAYGFLLLLSWQNLSRILDSLTAQVLDQARRMSDPQRKPADLKPVRLGDFDLSWEEALSASRFPLIARNAGFIPRRSTLANLRSMVADQDLIQRCARPLRQIGFSLERR